MKRPGSPQPRWCTRSVGRPVRTELPLRFGPDRPPQVHRRSSAREGMRCSAPGGCSRCSVVWGVGVCGVCPRRARGVCPLHGVCPLRGCAGVCPLRRGAPGRAAWCARACGVVRQGVRGGAPGRAAWCARACGVVRQGVRGGVRGRAGWCARCVRPVPVVSEVRSGGAGCALLLQLGEPGRAARRVGACSPAWCAGCAGCPWCALPPQLGAPGRAALCVGPMRYAGWRPPPAATRAAAHRATAAARCARCAAGRTRGLRGPGRCPAGSRSRAAPGSAARRGRPRASGRPTGGP